MVDRLDHQMINDLDPFKVLNPSAENLAKYFFDETNVNLESGHPGPRAGEERHRLRNRHDDSHLFRIAAATGN